MTQLSHATALFIHAATTAITAGILSVVFSSPPALSSLSSSLASTSSRRLEFHSAPPPIMTSTTSAISNTSHVQRVLLLGGSGTAGAHIARAFLLPEYARKAHLSILSRKETATTAGPKKVALDALVEQGAEVVHGDLSTSTDAELVQLFSGQDVIVSAVGSEQLSAQARYITAAKLAGVQWFVPSEFGGDSQAVGRGSLVSLYDTKIDVQAAVKASGLDYTFVYTGGFSEYLLSPFLGLDLANNTLTAQGASEVSFNTTPLTEVGRQVADAIVSGRGRSSIIYTGDRITFQQLGDIVEKATGKKLTRKVRTQAQAEAAVAANPGDYPARFGAIFAASRGTGWPANQTYAAQNGLKVQTFEEFAQKALAGERQ